MSRAGLAGLAALAWMVWPGASAVAQEPGHRHSDDSAFAAMQHRGAMVMGVDQYTSVHHFRDLPDGGIIIFERDRDDSGVAIIRRHLQSIAHAFAQGDFSDPHAVHDREVPGTRVMAQRRERIRYEYRERPLGGEVRIRSEDSAAIAAIHQFLAFQRRDHRAGG